MKEFDILEAIKGIIKNDYIGDDCAYLKDLGIVITQDSLVEGIHFSREFSTAYQIGYKSIAVNLSDIYASGAEAKYLTVSLSLPKELEINFVEDFYKGANDALNGAKIVGGDITGADKIYISVTAIGSTKNRRISSRKNAKPGYKIITNGTHGASGAGLYALQHNLNGFETLKKEHLTPFISAELSEAIATSAEGDYAMMDSSDGLMDALFKIAESSGVLAEIDFDKVSFDKKLLELNEIDYKKMIFYGGEDYRLVCAISTNDLKKIDDKLFSIIGEIKEKEDENLVKINFENEKKFFNKELIEKNLFSHFN